MPDLLSELKEKRKQIEDLEKKRARQEGQREQLLKRLKEEFGISAEDIEKHLETMGKELVADEELLKNCRDEMEEILSGVHSKDSARESKEE
jgi:predicted transcriptional regulator